jgi:hypothetical protein
MHIELLEKEEQISIERFIYLSIYLFIYQYINMSYIIIIIYQLLYQYKELQNHLNYIYLIEILH